MLLLTKLKGYKSNFYCQWTYIYLFHCLKFNFKWPSMAFISGILSSKILYQRIAPGSFRTSSLLRQDIAFSPTHSNPLGGSPLARRPPPPWPLWRAAVAASNSSKGEKRSTVSSLSLPFLLSSTTQECQNMRKFGGASSNWWA